jgi:hypothetical protein
MTTQETIELILKVIMVLWSCIILAAVMDIKDITRIQYLNYMWLNMATAFAFFTTPLPLVVHVVLWCIVLNIGPKPKDKEIEEEPESEEELPDDRKLLMERLQNINDACFKLLGRKPIPDHDPVIFTNSVGTLHVCVERCIKEFDTLPTLVIQLSIDLYENSIKDLKRKLKENQ